MQRSAGPGFPRGLLHLLNDERGVFRRSIGVFVVQETLLNDESFPKGLEEARTRYFSSCNRWLRRSTGSQARLVSSVERRRRSTDAFWAIFSPVE